MHRRNILELIKTYRNHQEIIFGTKQDEILNLFDKFVALHPNCFERSNPLGHITASAFIISEDFKQIVLLKHKNLKKWIQVGGHADGHPLIHEVAYKEAVEETALPSLRFFEFFKNISHPFPLDFDIHIIPAIKDVPSHLHFDVRFLLMHNKKHQPINSDESDDIKWIPLSKVKQFSTEQSLLRSIEKIILTLHGKNQDFLEG